MPAKPWIRARCLVSAKLFCRAHRFLPTTYPTIPMGLTDEQLHTYRTEGYLFIEDYFSESEISEMHREFNQMKTVDTPGRVMEDKGDIVRALHGCHDDSKLFNDLTALPRMVEPCRQILDGDVYVYQFKINCKLAMGGEAWQWHQDYTFWKHEDGMPAPLAVNVAIFLDPVTEFNGPLIVIPRSHQKGVLTPAIHSEDGEDWTENVSATLRYTVGADVLSDLVDEKDMVAPKGESGSVLFFHPNIVHGSVANLSPDDRKLLIITYNRTSNAPDPATLHRPEFLVSRDSSPIVSLERTNLVGASDEP